MLVTASTAPLAMKIMRINVWRMGFGAALISTSRPRRDDVGGPQQLGADGQTRGSRRLHIDAQADAIVLGKELDHAAALGGVFEFRDGQDAVMIQGVQDLMKFAPF